MAEKTNNKGKECCLCGDIGFSDALLLCPTCGFRFQHTYCSGSYPKIDMDKWRCEWCIHDEAKKRGSDTFNLLLNMPAKSSSSSSPPKSMQQQEDHHRLHELQTPKKKPRRKIDDRKRPKQKRQLKSLDRWHHDDLNCNSSSSPRVIGRRYKLLADVLC